MGDSPMVPPVVPDRDGRKRKRCKETELAPGEGRGSRDEECTAPVWSINTHASCMHVTFKCTEVNPLQISLHN